MDFSTHSKTDRPFDLRTTILSLVVVIAAIVVPTQFHTKTQETAVIPTTPVVEQVCRTNQTNTVERAVNSNLDWFKNGSNYIWDGWKIK